MSEQFQKMFGDYGFDHKRDIAGIVVIRWGHAYVVTLPGFFFGKDRKPAVKDVLRKPRTHRLRSLGAARATGVGDRSCGR
jgi:hypothetical protein